MTRPAQALIDIQALQHNLRCVKNAAPQSRVMAIIKADAYGHGIVRAARALAAADGFGVASIDEAIVLREAGVTHPVTLLEGVFEASELTLVRQHGLSMVVHHAAQIDMLEATTTGAPIPVWLKIDSGMHRLGFAPTQVQPAWQRLSACAAVRQPSGLLTHFACADERDNSATQRQQECFGQATAGWSGERSSANSAAILAWPQTHGDWVRPGIMLYGVSPFAGERAQAHGLQAVMTLRSSLIAVHQLQRGDAIGYGASYVCPQAMPVGVVAIGYGDGYPRHAQTGTPVLVNGQRVPLIGRVSMDMISVDLSELRDVRVGDPVVLWGAGLPVEEIAEHAATLAYELLCGVARRVRCIEV
ncbi:MAG: alanine racemase [Gammaproteobacteria bacterium]|nr:alanine racemase [Gammaproteobacteria bacterium]